VISLIVGVAITVPILVWWHTAPPDLSWLYGDFTMFGALIRPVLRVEYKPAVAVLTGVALLLTALIAALYPAARAARMPPADTLSGI
jgi:ABC-type lipoprotein release transport system permease subunit